MATRSIPATGRRAGMVAGGVAAAWVAGYALAQHLSRGSPTAALWVADVVYLVPIAAAGALCLRAAVAATGRRRRFWALVAASVLLWLAGEVMWMWYEMVRRVEVPFPGPPDVLYVASYLPILLALLGLGGDSVPRRFRALLDASVVALVVSAVVWQLVIAPQLSSGLGLGALTAAAPALLDVAVLVVLGTLGATRLRRLPPGVFSVMLAYVVFALVDAAYGYILLVGDGTYPVELNLGWQVAAVLIAVGAVRGRRGADRTGARPVRSDPGLPLVLVGVVVALTAMLVDSMDQRLELWVRGLGAYVVAAVIARLLLASREQDVLTRDLERALAEQERLAVTDGLTGLYNRRFVEEMLQLEASRALRAGERLGLMVIDVDHFKAVNDVYGHQAGDDVLRAMAERLRGAVRRHDVVGRYGGEEFVVILPGVEPDLLPELAERCRRAVAGHPFPVHGGPPLALTVSLGVATLPRHAVTASELVRTADRALYLAKAAGRNRVQVGADPAVPAPDPELESMRALPVLERMADLVDLFLASREHSTAVARYAGQVADRLGLPAETRRRCELAGRLHDVGKIAVPPEVLTKPGRLDAAEWVAMRRHPEQSAWMVGLVPGLGEVSGIVRQHHERPDGTGYPDGSTGTAFRIEARIIAVCDAWAAMLADRSYQPPTSPARARRVLREGAGTQWDAGVVVAFLALEAAGEITPLGLLEPGPLDGLHRRATLPTHEPSRTG